MGTRVNETEAAGRESPDGNEIEAAGPESPDGNETEGAGPESPDGNETETAGTEEDEGSPLYKCSSFLRNCPVYEPATCATSSGVPVATM